MTRTPVQATDYDNKTRTIIYALVSNPMIPKLIVSLIFLLAAILSLVGSFWGDYSRDSTINNFLSAPSGKNFIVAFIFIMGSNIFTVAAFLASLWGYRKQHVPVFKATMFLSLILFLLTSARLCFP